MNRLFTEYTDVNCTPLLKSNIEVVAPLLWVLVDNDTQEQLGLRYVRARTGSSAEVAILAFNFFKLIDGIAAIPEAYRRPMYEKQASELLKVHFERDNFYKEPSAAKALAAIGSEVPAAAAPDYVKAVMLSFLGNPYNRSTGARQYNEDMISGFNQACIKAVIHLINTDKDIMLALTNRRPATYFVELIELMLKRPLTPKQETFLKQFQGVAVKEVTELFREKVFG